MKNNRTLERAQEVVMRTLSSESKSGIVLAAYTGKNGSLSDSALYVKGDPIDAVSMITTALLDIFDKHDISLEGYMCGLLRISEKRKNSRSTKKRKNEK